MKVKGFSASAVQAGIRYKDRLDLGLIYSDIPAVTAGVFTTNKVKAAPILLDIERLRHGKAQAVLVNSGNANACTGEQGMETALQTGKLTARALGIDETLVQVASTGVIGEQLDLDPFVEAIPTLAEQLSPGGFDDLARSIMTTDTVPKISSASIQVNDTEVRLFGIAKGSGMIMPDMATMLCFVVTDAQVVFPTLKEAVRLGVEQSFNRITVDGDTSTNDMVLVMANGAAGNEWIDDENPDGQKIFADALLEIFKDLAIQIVKDGEGATKLVTVRVIGAREREGAMSAAQTIANSALVKTAFFASDPNWGRILAAVGRAGVQNLDLDAVRIFLDDVCIVSQGGRDSAYSEERGQAVMDGKEITVRIVLGRGESSARVWTCDLSYDYVRINAEYRT